MDVQKREDRMLDEISRLYKRQQIVLSHLDLWESCYPEIKSFTDDVRRNLIGRF